MADDRSGWSEAWLAHRLAQHPARVQPPPPPFELKPPPPPWRGNRHGEEELQSAIVKVWRPLLVPGARLLACNGELPGGAEMVARAKRRKGMGYTRGTPDMVAIRPGALAWLEIKIKGNSPTDEQRDFGEWARSCSHGWEVVYSLEDAGSALKAWEMVR